MYKRVLLKLSGEALSGNGNNFDPEVLKHLALELKEVHKLGFTERLGFLYYRHETRKFETVEIEMFELKERE